MKSEISQQTNYLNVYNNQSIDCPVVDYIIFEMESIINFKSNKS